MNKLPFQAINKLTRRLLSQVNHARSWLKGFGGGSAQLTYLGDYGVITLENQGKGNSLTGKMMVDLESVITSLEKGPPRGIVLRGENEIFCTGFDLNFIQHLATPHHATMLCSFMQDVTYRMKSLPCPSVALIEGCAVGGGAELAVSCDWRVMHPKSWIEFRQSKIGVTTGWGGGTKLVQLVGPSEALKILLSSKKIQVDEAVRLRIADFVLADDVTDNLGNVLNWFQTMYGDIAIETIHGMKKLVNAVNLEHTTTDILHRERKIFESVWGGPIQQRILAKIFEKKKE